MRIEVSEQLEVFIYHEGADVPFLYQPTYPDGTPFASLELAQAWAEEYVAARLAEEAEDVGITNAE